MRIAVVLLSVAIMQMGFAQNIELFNGKDIKQPGKLNPALVASGGDLIRVISDFQLNESAQFMLEGRIPLGLGNYMVGVERTFTDDVANNMFNITYGRKSKENDKKLQWRYGGSIQFNQKSISMPGYDSTSQRYTYRDLDGEVRYIKNRDEILSGVNYFDAQLGINLNYRNLLAGLSIEDFLGQNVSLNTLEQRQIPFTANVLIGGFFNIGEEFVVFPSALIVSNKDNFYTKASLDLSVKQFNFTTAYVLENDFQDLSAAVGYRFKKSFAGIKYNHPLSENATPTLSSELPSFNLFFNSTLFKSRDLFKGDFAKRMRRFY
ncbi:MAG: type IX secretion system membrane protein PorP/SprF [Bacteroidetes bacterium]|jgi:hypothetical protein|nr:type IX secretion system membrane protein PorP/SprF [Bacteroidota bacterium]